MALNVDWHQSAEEGNISSLELLIAAHENKQKDPFAYLYGNPLAQKDDLDEVFTININF